MKTSCMPQTKYAHVITTNEALPHAIFAATPAEVSAIWADVRGGSGILPTPPADQAARTSASDQKKKPARPVRPPRASPSPSPLRAANRHPLDPAAHSIPPT